MIVLQNPGPIGSSVTEFAHASNMVRKSALFLAMAKISVLFQRISVTIQRFNSALLHDSFCTDCPNQKPFQLCCWLSFLTLGIFSTKGIETTMVISTHEQPAALLSMVEVEYILVEVLRSSSRVSSSDKLPPTSDGELVERRSSVDRGLACRRGDARDAEIISCCCCCCWCWAASAS